MQVEEFNQLSQSEARAGIEPCLGVSRWVEEVVSARPYFDVAALLEQGRASAENLTDDELDSALSGHPRIGEISAAGRQGAAYSVAEQSEVDSDDDTAARLAAANQRYEDRFDRLFIVRAAGRDTAEVLAELERRLGNTHEAERREVVSELRQIALLRLEQVVRP